MRDYQRYYHIILGDYQLPPEPGNNIGRTFSPSQRYQETFTPPQSGLFNVVLGFWFCGSGKNADEQRLGWAKRIENIPGRQNVKGIHRIKIKIFPFTSSVRETNIKPWCVLPQTQTKLSTGKNDNSSQVLVLVCLVDVSSFSLSLTDNLGQTTPILWGCWGFVWAGIKFESSKENLKPPDDQQTMVDHKLWELHNTFFLFIDVTSGQVCH